MLVKKIFLCGAAERFSAASFWEGGNVDGRKKRRDSKNKRTASGAGQYQGVTGAFGTTGHGTGKGDVIRMADHIDSMEMQLGTVLKELGEMKKQLGVMQESKVKLFAVNTIQKVEHQVQTLRFQVGE